MKQARPYVYALLAAAVAAGSIGGPGAAAWFVLAAAVMLAIHGDRR